jgi:predicted Fe-S protein YdhL (DUF1289 family)
MITSPCIGICEYDPVTGLCLGCARSRDEIARWGGEAEGWRQQVWGALPARRRQLGIELRRPDWTAEDIRRFVRGTLENAGGTWVLGCYGGVAEFVVEPDAAVTYDAVDPTFTVRSGKAALRLAVPEHIRALQLGGQDGAAPRMTILAIHKIRLRLPVADCLTRIGPDAAAIDPAHRAATLFDLGLGRAGMRFMVRIADPALAALLDACEGATLAELLVRAGAALLAAGPTRVIETALGRAEIDGPIPPPHGQSPSGSHTHLLPAALATGRDLPPALDLPAVYAPAAVFYPPADADCP